MQVSDDESKKTVSSVAVKVENGEISSSSYKWNECLDAIFVSCLSDNSDKIGKPIKNYFDLFIDTSLNHMSIRSCLISQPRII